MRILLVEDDEIIVEALTKVLSDQHYIVDRANDGQSGWELAESLTYDLMLLDVMLPRLDGISLCRQLRSAGNLTPILLLTAQDASTHKVMGLDAGADDYLAKPFDPQELLARIRALLRRGAQPRSPLLQWRNLQLDPSTCEVSHEGTLLHLTPKEYSVLELLLRNPHRIYSCSALIDHLWSLEDPPTEETVRSHIKGLRHKLKAVGLLDDPVETVYGIGYRLRTVEAIVPLSKATSSPGLSARSSKKKSSKKIESPQPAKLPYSSTDPDFPPIATTHDHTTHDHTTHDHTTHDRSEPISQKPVSSVASHLDEGMMQIWSRVRQQLFERVSTIAQVTTYWKTQSLDSGRYQQAYQEAHKLAGSLGMFGADRGSHYAQAIEQFFSAPSSNNPRLDAPLEDQDAQQVDRWIQALQQEVNRLESQAMPNWLANPELEDVPAISAQDAQVLIVDDDVQILESLQHLLVPWGLQVTTVRQPSQLWESLTKAVPDLLILDVELPETNGITLCQELRAQPQWSGLPVLFLTAHTDAHTMHQVFTAGADDFVSKPIVGPELVTRILNRLERSRLLRSLTETDALTGLLNRRQSIQEIRQMLMAETRGRSGCLALLYLEHLKRLNHTYGYLMVDQAIYQFGKLLRRTFHPTDVVGRWSGAEFIIGLPDRDKSVAVAQLWEMLHRWQPIRHESPSEDMIVTCKAAIVQYPQHGTDVQTIYQVADAMLERMRSAPGGNDVQVAD